MLLAVLDKLFRFGLNNRDTYVAVGGLRITEPSADLAIAGAIVQPKQTAAGQLSAAWRNRSQGDPQCIFGRTPHQ